MQRSKNRNRSNSLNWPWEPPITRILMYLQSSLWHLAWKPPLWIYAMKSAFCLCQSPEGRGCYPWDQFCAGALQMAQPTSTSQKIQSSALFVARVNTSAKACKFQEWENGHISAKRPPIKNLSTLFTIQLLILVPATPKISKKLCFVAKMAQRWFFQLFNFDNIWKVEKNIFEPFWPQNITFLIF